MTRLKIFHLKKKSIIVLSFIIFTLTSTLTIADVPCIGVYVGRISVNKNDVIKVVFLSHPKNTSGSYWTYLIGWKEKAKDKALSLLMFAKAAHHRVDIYTDANDHCSISEKGQRLTEVHLSTNP
jgi:hypothetical protein